MSKMSYKGETAYITGGASGIARSLADRLVERGMKVVVADWNIEGANKAAKELNEAAGSSENSTAWAVEVDVSNWDSQKKAFEFAVEKLGGRIDYVFPVAGITERDWTPVKAKGSEFVKPNLQVFDVNGTGPLYTTSLAVQQFRDQELNKYGFRGKIVIVSSGCGFYYMPSLPIYTASKHAIVGFVRTYGRLITEENITLNTLCPNIVRTGISSGEFYDKAGKDGLLVETEGLLQAFEALLGDAPGSGDAIEVLPGDGGFRVKERPEYTNEKCQISVEMVQERTYNAFKAKREAEAAAAKKR